MYGYRVNGYYEVQMNLYGKSCSNINIIPTVSWIPLNPNNLGGSYNIDDANYFMSNSPLNYSAYIQSYFQNYEPEPLEEISHLLKYVTIESTKSFNIHSIQLFNKENLSVPLKITRKNNNLLIELDPSEIIGYSFITGHNYHPESWTIKGSSSKKWFLIEKRKFKPIKHALYQMPLFYFNGETKVLPQPKSMLKDKPDEKKIYEPDTKVLQKYYKQKINPSRVPDFKKHYVENDTYYYLYDEYDLNKKLLASDLVIGFVLKNDKVKNVIMYENEDGEKRGFDLRKKEDKHYWDANIMIDPGFFSPSNR
jgi:hypothetical protein